MYTEYMAKDRSIRVNPRRPRQILHTPFLLHSSSPRLRPTLCTLHNSHPQDVVCARARFLHGKPVPQINKCISLHPVIRDSSSYTNTITLDWTEGAHGINAVSLPHPPQSSSSSLVLRFRSDRWLRLGRVLLVLLRYLPNRYRHRRRLRPDHPLSIYISHNKCMYVIAFATLSCHRGRWMVVMLPSRLLPLRLTLLRSYHVAKFNYDPRPFIASVHGLFLSPSSHLSPWPGFVVLTEFCSLVVIHLIALSRTHSLS